MTTRTHCPSSGDLVGGSRTQFAQICRRTKGTRACAATDKRTDCRTVAFRRAAHGVAISGSRILQDCVLHEQLNSSPEMYAKVMW
ncbi:GM16167 [Drosophila sechellia]|uniref:GM16167 n=1 Tax=Drosophila sechellia TaxID=7238 RepID=B4HXT7_DROSE|nr:GM16167 [Drosophila sechellia]